MAGDESTEASGQALRKMAVAASFALSTAELSLQMWAKYAEWAAATSEQRAKEAQERLRAERELAASSWRQLRTLNGHPEQLGQALASAAAWAPHDSRAARALASVQQRMKAAGVHWHPDQQRQRARDDYAAMMLLLQRKEEARRQAGGTTGVEAGPSTAEFYATGDPVRDMQVQRAAAALNEDEAEQVLHSDGWGALKDSMDRAAAAGYSPELLLKTVREQRPLDQADVAGPARDIGAVLHWRLERHLNGHPVPDAGLTPQAFEAQQAAPEPAFESASGRPEAAVPSEAGDAAQFGQAREPARVREAADLVTRSQFSASRMLQRKLGVEEQQAEELLDALEARGIVGPSRGSFARTVLASPASVEQHLHGAPPIPATDSTRGAEQQAPASGTAAAEPDVVERTSQDGGSTLYLDPGTAQEVAAAEEQAPGRWADGSEAARLAGQAAPEDLELSQHQQPDHAAGGDGARHPLQRPWMQRMHDHERGE